MFNHVHRNRLPALILLLICSILFGCGQKGDLYLPTEQSQNQSKTQDKKQP
jgi:predicted small lipoprotein YifL